MYARYRFTTLFLSLLLAAPAAVAGWAAHGSFEPDTPHDATGDFMYTDPNVDRNAKKVYLNVIATQYLTATNPNLPVLETRALSASFTLEALFGVWVDCNKDGYIGMAEGALLEYRSELLTDTSVCPSQSKSHNEQSWVSELRWIGYPQGADGNDPDNIPDGRDGRVYYDWGADIWGDFTLPGEELSISTLEQCILYYHRTGQTANYLDCLARRYGADASDAGAAAGFERNDNGRVNYDSTHPLNVETLGDDDADQRMVTVWDCNQDRTPIATPLGSNQKVDQVIVGDVKGPGVDYTDENGELNITVYDTTNTNGSDWRNNRVRSDPHVPRIPAPGSGTGNSIAGTWNHTTDGATGNCDPSDGAGSLYASEGSPDARQPGKSRPSITFSWFEEQRSGASKRGQPSAGAPTSSIYPGARMADGNRWFGGNWIDTGVDTTKPQRAAGAFVRDDLTPVGARYFTFYANLTSESFSKGLQVPRGAGNPGLYGDEWCQGATSGVIRGFNCNPDEWYLESDGTRLEGNQFQVFAGHPYYLRDIDCYDRHMGAGIYMSAGATDPSQRCPEI